MSWSFERALAESKLVCNGSEPVSQLWPTPAQQQVRKEILKKALPVSFPGLPRNLRQNEQIKQASSDFYAMHARKRSAEQVKLSSSRPRSPQHDQISVGQPRPTFRFHPPRLRPISLVAIEETSAALKLIYPTHMKKTNIESYHKLVNQGYYDPPCIRCKKLAVEKKAMTWPRCFQCEEKKRLMPVEQEIANEKRDGRREQPDTVSKDEGAK